MSSPGARLTLVIPSLAGGLGDVAPVPRLPALERLIARGRREALPELSREHHLATLFGLSPEGDLPLGALCRIGEGAGVDEGWWFRAAPAHFFAARDRLRLASVEEVAEEEARLLVTLFNNHFGADGWRLEAAAPSQWYLRAPGPQALRTRPLQEAAAGDLRGVLPEGPDALHCHRFMNEVQMLFHRSVVNEQREQRGLAAINGLWFWGGGHAPTLARRFDQVWSDLPLVRGLARVSGAVAQSPPARLPPVSGAALALLEPEATADAWRALEEGWFAAAERGVREGRLEELVIDGGAQFAVCVTQRDLRRWWRRRRALDKP